MGQSIDNNTLLFDVNPVFRRTKLNVKKIQSSNESARRAKRKVERTVRSPRLSISITDVVKTPQILLNAAEDRDLMKKGLVVETHTCNRRNSMVMAPIMEGAKSSEATEEVMMMTSTMGTIEDSPLHRGKLLDMNVREGETAAAGVMIVRKHARLESQAVVSTLGEGYASSTMKSNQMSQQLQQLNGTEGMVAHSKPIRGTINVSQLSRPFTAGSGNMSQAQSKRSESISSNMSAVGGSASVSGSTPRLRALSRSQATLGGSTTPTPSAESKKYSKRVLNAAVIDWENVGSGFLGRQYPFDR